LRSCRCFEEEIDLRATAKHGLFLLWLSGDSDFLIGEIKKAENVQGRKPLDAQQVAVREKRRDRLIYHGKSPV